MLYLSTDSAAQPSSFFSDTINPSVMSMAMSQGDVSKLNGVQTLFFDVFGTVVDYVETVTKALQREVSVTSMADADALRTLRRDYDWRYFTVHWREQYLLETRRLAQIGNPDKITVDQMHMAALNRLITALPLSSNNNNRAVGSFPIDKLSKALDQAWTKDTRQRLNLTWHLLEPWPDSVAGLQALKSHFKIGTLTNGNLNLMVDMAKHAKLPWDFMLTADVLGSFKPDPQMYRKAMQVFDIEPDVDGHHACMVAAHVSRACSTWAGRADADASLPILLSQLFDLEAAKACGMTTVFVSSRPTEEPLPAQGKPDYVDIVVADLLELAHLVQ